MAKSLSFNINGSWIALPRCFYTIEQSDENRTYTMASGKKKVVVVGTRKILNASFEYIPAETLTALNSAIKSNPLIETKYFDVNGNETTGTFIVKPVSPTVFKYTQINGVTKAVWSKVTIEAEEQTI